MPAFLSITAKAFTQIVQPKDTPLLTAKAMDILFNGIGINCDREEQEARLVCPKLAKGKAVKSFNETYFTVSLLGGVSMIMKTSQ